ncbi:hypothetical protein J6J34_00865 [Pseudidiomarina sp. 1ASP75-14]|uniref:hypothetical protein n=1 Tax=Pseudidiomarina terrestris TaxID=2820060 RepID=UPI00264BA3BF|nr:MULTISPECIES: hypothetical protein [unclassified Pseudidiomarina]MDN7126923.1 hypothetical protein [Pseudidiomarina sp. 1APR75-33.1]MDN7136767.1 hypothetical protein [Pseudidiomarina sp. 1ASP75-14]
MNRDDLILVDTNVIIEAHRVSILNEMMGCLNLATVDMCIIETQTGAQNRDPKFTIDEMLLREKMKIYSPGDEQILLASMQYSGIADVDDGERHLLTQASLLLGAEVWFLSSPDRHPMRLAIEYGWRDHLVSLEQVYRLANASRKVTLRDNFTETWHQRVCAEFVLNVRR